MKKNQLRQTTDRLAPQTLTLDKMSNGQHYDVMTGELIDPRELKQDYIVLLPGDSIKRGCLFNGKYFRYDRKAKRHVQIVPDLSVNVLARWMQ